MEHGINDIYHDRIYRQWRFMVEKCNDELNLSYENFGGNGIKVCDEWANSYRCFFNWAMENGYRDNLYIDRIDESGDYCPENCIYVEKKEIDRKRRKNFIEILGIKKPLKDWTEFVGWNYFKYYKRYCRGKEVFNENEIKEIEEKLRSENNG